MDRPEKPSGQIPAALKMTRTDMNSCLILVDLQNDYFPGGKMALVGIEEAAANAQILLNEFRKANLPEIHIRHISARQGNINKRDHRDFDPQKRDLTAAGSEAMKRPGEYLRACSGVCRREATKHSAERQDVRNQNSAGGEADDYFQARNSDHHGNYSGCTLVG
jgi:hypothetical protein